MKQAKQHKVNSLYVIFKQFARWFRAETPQPEIPRSLAGGAVSGLMGLALLVGGTSAYASVLNTATAVADNASPVSASICTAQVTGAVSVLNSVFVTADNAPDGNAENCIDIFNTFDFGDAPVSYGTLLANNGPRHVIVPDLFIGSVVDNESDGVPGSNADGDADEDGVAFSSPPGGAAAEIFADVTVTNNTGSPAVVCAWMDEWTEDDVNSPGIAIVDGVFDDDVDGADMGGECQSVTVVDGVSTLTFGWTSTIGDLPLPRVAGDTYFRFRLCQTQSECESPTSAVSAPSGEVEDYIRAFNFSPTAATIGATELLPISVEAFLDQFGVSQLSDADLLALLAAFDPEAAARLAGASREEILEALGNYLDPDGDGQTALFIWNTLEERGTIGFFVDRRTGTSGEWQRINNDMLPSLLSPIGGEYGLVDPQAVSGNTYQYRLIEQEASGTTNTYGPYTLEMP